MKKILALAVFCLVACKPSPNYGEFGGYIYDSKTDLCFMSYGGYQFTTEYTYVPCTEKVMQLVRNSIKQDEAYQKPATTWPPK